jgi:hypothetical protein
LAGKKLHHTPVKCRYLDYRLPNGHVIFLPLIHVEVASEQTAFGTVALLDSGATMSFIPYEIADILGIIPEQPTSIGVETAGGTCDFFQVSLKRLSIITGGKTYSDFRNMHVLVPSPDRDLPYVILGRDYIFKRFHITFRENIRKYELQHHKHVIT